MNKVSVSGMIGNIDTRYLNNGTPVRNVGVGVRGRKRPDEEKAPISWLNLSVFGDKLWDALVKFDELGAGVIFHCRVEINKTDEASYTNYIVESVDPVWPVAGKFSSAHEVTEPDAEEDFPF